MADIVHTIRLVASAKAAIEEVRKYQDTLVGAAQTVDKHAAQLSGDKVIKGANEWAIAVGRLGGATNELATSEQMLAGASKLTESEKAKLNRTVTEAIEKYRSLGQEAPQAMRDLAAATEPTVTLSQLLQEKWAAFAAAGAGAITSVRALAGQLTSWVSEASAAEDASVRLDTALRAQGSYTPALSAQYAALASEFQKTTVFSDDLVKEMQALLVQIGDVAPKDMKAALQASTDLAAGLRIDLNTATQLVGKAFAGETGTLKRYGIVIDESALKTKGAQAVIEAIANKMGGQASAQAATYAGQMKQLGNQFDDAKERAGDLLIKALLPVLQAFTNLSPGMQNVIIVGGMVVGVLGPLALAFTSIGGAIALLMPVLSVALPAALSALGVLMGPAGLVVAGIVAVVAAWKYWDQIVGFVKAVYDAVRMYLVDRFNAIVDSIKGKIDAVTGFFQGMYDKVVGHSIVPDMVNQVGAEFDRMGQDITAKTEAATSTVQETFARAFRDLPNLLMQAFTGGGGVSGAFNALGAEISNGLFGENGVFSASLSKAKASLSNSFMGKIGGALLDAIPGIGALIGPGIELLWSGIKKLFGGPSKEELAGRDLVAAFEDQLAGMMTAAQRAEAGNEAWKQTVIVLRDKYLELGLTAEQATADAERLWASSRDGGEDAQAVIDELTARIKEAGDAAEETAAKVTAATEEHAASLKDLLAKHESELTDLMREADSLRSSIAAEAEEEVMGVIEREQRAKLEQVEAAIDANQQEQESIKSIQDALANIPWDQFQADIRETFAQIPRQLEIELRGIWNIPSAPTSGGAGEGFAEGTGGRFLDFGAGTITTLHGKERVVTEAEGRREALSMSRLESELAGIRRDFKRLPQMMALAMKTALTEVG